MSEMIKDQETSSEQGNTGRRRLVRGAVAFAPLVLTLRSGGVLAAASCTGAKAVNVVLEDQGKIPESINLQAGDVCYQTVNVCSVAPPKVENPVGAPIGYDVNPSSRKCGSPGLAAGTNVAILSSASVTSFAH